MPVITLGAIGTALFGFASWFSSLPNTFKYIIFLTGLGIDAGLISGIPFLSQGILGTAITLIVRSFGFPYVVISSWQLLILFILAPIVFFMLSNSLSHQ